MSHTSFDLASLEPRLLLSAVITVRHSPGRLLVRGTRGYDAITVGLVPGDATRVRVTLNGKADGTFLLSDVVFIEIHGGRKGDRIRIDDSSGVIPKPIAIVGGAGNDTLMGGAGPEKLRDGPGDDLVSGGAGNDTLVGEGGRDTLRGGDGNDLLTPLASGAVLMGDGGADVLSAATVIYQLSTVLIGGDGPDTLRGGRGYDLLIGGPGDDLLDGNDRSDTLLGEAGNDTLLGASGNDDLDGGSDFDQLHGGGAADIFHATDDVTEIFGLEAEDQIIA